jgi:diguanylate cyclase (GGDEF)-like protein
MTPELDARLRSLVNFPSPPAVAARIIELSKQPNIEIASVAEAVGRDPALAAKVLRTANSPLYAKRRRSETLRQAIVILGLNATLTLALGFTLVKSLKGGKPNGVNHPLLWRRSLLAATAARALGEAVGQSALEELFLAGLLQDVGMLALDRAVPELYRDTEALQRAHRELAAHERRRLGLDHADAGSWLMREWNLPERLSQAVARSHKLESRRALDPLDAFHRCVSLSGGVADACIAGGDGKPFQEVARQAERELGLDREAFARVLERLTLQVAETEVVYETDLVANPQALLEQARDALLVMRMQTLGDGQGTAAASAAATGITALNADDAALLDPLTGAFRRAFLDRFLAEEFRQASRHETPLSVACCDLDGLGEVNERFGHGAGDRVLRATVATLKESVRKIDLVGRGADATFVLVLPGTSADIAAAVCERIVTALANLRHDLGAEPAPVTVSIGYATHAPGQRFADGAALVAAAEQALYAAKLQGRNRHVPYEAVTVAPVVQFL